MTSPTHASGTDCPAEANLTVQAERVINIHMDEPLVTGCANPRTGATYLWRGANGDAGHAVQARGGF